MQIKAVRCIVHTVKDKSVPSNDYGMAMQLSGVFPSHLPMLPFSGVIFFCSTPLRESVHVFCHVQPESFSIIKPAISYTLNLTITSLEGISDERQVSSGNLVSPPKKGITLLVFHSPFHRSGQFCYVMHRFILVLQTWRFCQWMDEKQTKDGRFSEDINTV